MCLVLCIAAVIVITATGTTPCTTFFGLYHPVIFVKVSSLDSGGGGGPGQNQLVYKRSTNPIFCS